MILKTMKLKNFRQFYGSHEINFGTGKHNTTLIIGANGNGKTGIFRALMFVLYGEKRLEQDPVTDVNLINLDAMHENEMQPVSSLVELSFIYNDKDYVIRREMRGIYDSKKDGIITQDKEPELFVYNDSGDYTNSNIDIELFIKRIIEPEIREFFFFDAEKMNLLEKIKSQKSFSEDIKDGIIRLLQVKYIENSINGTKTLINKVQRDISKKIKNTDIDSKEKEKKEIENEISRIKINLENSQKEKKGIVVEIKAIENKLNENKEINELSKEKEHYKERLGDKLELRGKYKANLKKYEFKDIFKYLAMDILGKNELHMREYVEKSTDKISIPVLEQSLEDMTCSLCRTKFTENSPQHLALNKLIENYKSSEATSIINGILSINNDIHSKLNEYISDLNTIYGNLSENYQEIESIQKEIEDLDEKIGDQASNIENLSRLEIDLENYRKELSDKEKNISNMISRKSLLKEQFERIESEIKTLEIKHSEAKKEIAIRNKIENFKNLLEETLKEYSATKTKELAEETFRVFKQLLDKKDIHNYKEVQINEDYEIKLVNKLDQDVFQDLSKGQDQIFALSLILSLAKLASRGRDEINFPLFMDTPFARLSRENRNNLIRNIPNLTNQWILLLTDTEFTSAEKDIFLETDKVGKIYWLNNKDGKTNIKEFSNLNQIKLEAINE